MFNTVESARMPPKTRGCIENGLNDALSRILLPFSGDHINGLLPNTCRI